MALKRERSASPSAQPSIFRSSKIEEQKSVFVAAFSTSLSAKSLQDLPEFKSATHKIAAWRKPSRQLSLLPNSKVLYDIGHDDDGERWAGGRLSNVLKVSEVEGAVVVARWYGGQNIGPVRFAHIENSAKEAVRSWKVAHATVQMKQTLKKQKLESSSKQNELVRNLHERDESIVALRKLLSQKKAKRNDEEPAPPTPQKPQAYEAMSTEVLVRIDKARDATIAFILKQIDKVEEDLSLQEMIEDSAQDSGILPDQQA